MAPGSMALATDTPGRLSDSAGQAGRRITPRARRARIVFRRRRVREEREGDLRAQLAALAVGAERLRALVASAGRATVASAIEALETTPRG